MRPRGSHGPESIIAANMDRADRQMQLNDGIKAVRAGDRARARELLMGVVQADDGNEPAGPDDTRCPHCGRGLLTSGAWHGGTYLYATLILAGILFQSAVVEALAVFLGSSFPETLRMVPFASLLTTNLLGPAVARLLL